MIGVGLKKLARTSVPKVPLSYPPPPPPREEGGGVGDKRLDFDPEVHTYANCLWRVAVIELKIHWGMCIECLFLHIVSFPRHFLWSKVASGYPEVMGHGVHPIHLKNHSEQNFSRSPVRALKTKSAFMMGHHRPACKIHALSAIWTPSSLIN